MEYNIFHEKCIFKTHNKGNLPGTKTRSCEKCEADNESHTCQIGLNEKLLNDILRRYLVVKPHSEYFH